MRIAWRRRLVRLVAKLMLRSYIRRVEVVGAERVPSEGAVLLFANHFSSLVDCMALIDASPRTASFLAKAPLWKSRILGLFLDATDALPVYRLQDRTENEGRTVRANVETFRACRERLAAGGSIALFPEGISQPRPRLMPLRTGAARLALDAGVPVAVCPVGLVYGQARPGHRNTLLVQFGEPWHINGSGGFTSRRAAIRETTRQMESALRELLAEAPSEGDLNALRALRISWDQGAGRSAPRTLAQAHRRDRVFARSLAALREHAPGLLDQLRADADEYLRAVRSHDIPLEKLRVRYTVPGVLRFLAINLPLAVVGFPLGIAAAILTWPIRRVGDLLALRGMGGRGDVRPLCRMVGTSGLLILLMVFGGIFAFLRWGTWPALGVVVGLPAILGFHIVWFDLGMSLRADIRCFFLLSGGNVRRELLRQRRRLNERVREARSVLEEAGALPSAAPSQT